MRGEVLALVTLALVLTLPGPVAKVVLGISFLSPTIACIAVCASWITVFLSATLLGFLASVLAFVFNWSLQTALLFVVASSAIASLGGVLAYAKDKLELYYDSLTSLLILLSVGLAYFEPEASTQVMMSLSQSLWLVDPATATTFFLVSVTVAVLALLFEFHLAALLFDVEFLEYKEAKWEVVAWLALTLVTLGAAFSSYTIGFFATNVMLPLPAIVAIRHKLRERSEVFWLVSSLTALSLWIGCELSQLYNVSEVGVAGLILLLLLVSLELWRWKGGASLRFTGVRRAELTRSDKGDEQQEDEARAVEEGERGS